MLDFTYLGELELLRFAFIQRVVIIQFKQQQNLNEKQLIILPLFIMYNKMVSQHVCVIEYTIVAPLS